MIEKKFLEYFRLYGLSYEDSKYKMLRVKIIAITLSFSFIPLLVLSVSFYSQFTESYTSKTKENLSALVENKQRAIDLFLNERVSQLSTLAYSHSFQELKNQEKLDALFALIQSRAKFYVDFGIIDSEGNHVAYSGPFKLEYVNYKNEFWFEKVMRSGVFISDVFMGFRKFPHFIIAVKRREGNKDWILRATIDSEIFESLVRFIQLGKRGDAYLVNSQHVLQTSPRFGSKILQMVPLPDFSRFSGSRIEILNEGEVKYLYGIAWLENKDWMLVVKEDAREELFNLFRAQTMVITLLLIGGFVCVLGTIVLTNSVIKKLIQADREKAQLDAGLLQSSKMAALGKLAAGIAHEVNNPLAIIKEKAGWMKDLLAEEDVAASKNFQEFAESLAKIEYHVERARTVTHRMLGFARRMEPVQEKIDVNTVVEQTLQFLKNEAMHRDIEINTDFMRNIPQFTSDSAQIQQVFLNIVNNAIDAIGKKGAIYIKTGVNTHMHDREVFVCITDTGPGMSKDLLEKIFDPFFTTKKVGEGTGLGLSISFSIMEKLGGRITVDSDIGKGTTFTIVFPVK